MGTFEPETNDEAWHLLRKIFLLLLVVTASALGLVLLSRRGSAVPPVLFNILADASLGLLAGLAARFALRYRSPFIQGLASAAASIVGLAVLGYFTGWKSGIGPFQAGAVTVHSLEAWHLPVRLPLAFDRGGMDVVDLVNVVIAVDISWIALRVWRQGVHATADSLSPAPLVRRPGRMPRPSVVPAAPAPSAPFSPAPSPRPRIKRNKVAERPRILKPAPAIRPMRAKTQRRGRVRSGQSAVHLAVHEEHRCPYCLEPVKRNDPRGSVECQVCHTLHHKDCWDITGSCQVPHLNT